MYAELVTTAKQCHTLNWIAFFANKVVRLHTNHYWRTVFISLTSNSHLINTAYRRCSLMLQMLHSVWFVMWCWAQWWARQRCWADWYAIWGASSCGPREPCIRWGTVRHLANMTEWFVHGGNAAVKLLWLLVIINATKTTTTTTATTITTGTTWVSRYQKGKTSLELNEARDYGVLGWQWHQLDHKQTICTLLHIDNHTNTSSVNF